MLLLCKVKSEKGKTMKSFTQNQNGGIHLPIIAVIILVGVIAFTAGVAYRIQTNRASIEVASSDESELHEIKEVDIEDIIAVLPEERKEEVEKEEEKTPKEAPTEKTVSPSPEKPKDKTTQEKDKTYKDPSVVKISNITITKTGTTYTLTATLPQSYSGTCQGLLKPESGGEHKDHINVSKSFSGSTCSVEVQQSQLDGFSPWRTYMSFYSSDKTVKSHWTRADNITPQ